MSGGLDSTFVAATLARQTTPDRPVIGLIHVPLAEAQLQPRGGMDPDESHLAHTLAAAYPGRLVVREVRNEELISPLDASAEMSTRSWLPVFNPANQSWMTAMNRIAAHEGAELLFAGGNGNAAFSHDHPYAARYYLSRGRLPTLLSLGTVDGSPSMSRLRGRVLSPLLPRTPQPPTSAHLGLPPTPPPRHEHPRIHYLRWLARANSGLMAAQNPAATEGILKADPFLARAVLDVAAAIEPAEWQRGGGSRSFARRLGLGRVPDDIRLRKRRGAQGWDAWYVVRNDRDRYLAEIDLLRDTPALGGWVDDRRLAATVAAWPWGATHGPGPGELHTVHRLLALAAFARDTTRRLATLTSQPVAESGVIASRQVGSLAGRRRG
ncbi:MAG: asparagine synthase-related protein [Candidatus Nanopelagicales bacterium]